MREVAFTTYSGIWIPATTNTGTGGGRYLTLNDQGPRVVPAEEAVTKTKVDMPTAALYFGILLSLIGFVFGIAYPHSGMAILFPVGLTVIWALGSLIRPKGEPFE